VTAGGLAEPERPGRVRRAHQPPVDQPGAFQARCNRRSPPADPDEFGNITVKQTATAVVASATRQRSSWRLRLWFELLLDRSRGCAFARIPASRSNAHVDRQAHPAAMQSFRRASRRRESTRSSTNRPVHPGIGQRRQETIIEAILLVILVVVIFLQTWRGDQSRGRDSGLADRHLFFMALSVPRSNNLSCSGSCWPSASWWTMRSWSWRTVDATSRPARAARSRHQEHGRGRLRADRHRAGAVRVFIPSGFITGIRAFYRQFALTIAGATVISLIVSLTLSPALAALLLKRMTIVRRAPGAADPGFFRVFNRGFDRVARGYGWLAARVVRFAVLMLVVYVGVLASVSTSSQDAVGLHPASIAASSSSSRSFRPGPRWRVPTRSPACGGDRAEDAPAFEARWNIVGSRRDLHGRTQFRRDFVVLDAFAARSRIRRGITARVQGTLRDPGRR